MSGKHPQQTVYKSRVKHILLLLISWCFTVACYWLNYTGGLIFFGLCALVATYPFLNPKQKIIFTDTKAFNEQTKKDFKFIYNDSGIFTYSTNGFEAAFGTQTSYIDWKEIRAIFGYKADLFNTDLICLEIYHNADTVIRLTEETAGWHQFLRKMAEHFSSVDPKWHIDISAPAFETNLTLVYEKDGMELAQAVKVYYPQ